MFTSAIRFPGNCCRLMRDWKLESLQNDKEIFAVTFQMEKEIYLLRHSQATITDRISTEISVPFHFHPKFPDYFAVSTQIFRKIY